MPRKPKAAPPPPAPLLYLDSSALVKLWIAEPETAAVRRLVADHAVCASSALALPEIAATFERARRGRRWTAEACAAASLDLQGRWRRLLSVRLGDDVALRAAVLAQKHGLRGADAVHLASALLLVSPNGPPVHFAAYDKDLARAAGEEGLTLAA